MLDVRCVTHCHARGAAIRASGAATEELRHKSVLLLPGLDMLSLVQETLALTWPRVNQVLVGSDV